MDMRNFYRRNLPVLLVLGIILALAGAGAAKQAAALPAGSWGLSFQQEGQPPVGNTTADRLRQYDAAFLGDTAQKRIYLTFDAGYENGCTAQILDALQKHHAPAAFFLVGNYLETSGTALFAYAVLKGVRLGYLPKRMAAWAEKAFYGTCDRYLSKNPDGSLQLDGICLVAGLGGKDHRDGSLAYYFSEPVVCNDAKGVGPLVLAYTEMIARK